VADNPASGNPPPTEALNFLCEGLKEAKQRFQAGQDGGRDGAIHALEMVLKFLGLFEPVRAAALHAPLARLFTDLMALDDGEVSPLLAPRKRSGRARANPAYDALKGAVVFTVQRLAATGLTQPEARRIVADEMARLGVRPARKGSNLGSGRFSERTLRKWQDDIGINETATDTLKLLEVEHSREVLVLEGADLQRRRLDRLAAFVAITRTGAATEKPPIPGS
jgi:hypothetical protein